MIEGGAEEVINTILAVERRIISTVNDRISNVEARLLPIERNMARVNENILDMREDLDAALSAIDEQGMTLIDHQKRIGRLEKRVA